MKYAFRSTCYIGASFLTAEQRKEIVRHAVTEVEKMKPYHRDVVILNEHRFDLKIVVRFTEQEIHIMTTKEATEAGLMDLFNPHEPSDN